MTLVNMNRWNVIRIALIGFMLLSVNRLFAHEPLFGLGPHTVGQYSWALESELERDQESWANHFELAYGITPNLVVTTALPFLLSQKEGNLGFGELAVRGKYRFYRRDYRNGSDGLAFHWGIKFPTSSRSENRGSGTTDYFVGLSFGRETRHRYVFAGLRYQVNGTIENLDRGNILNLDAAYGIRPWKAEYMQPDLVFLLETLGEVTGRNSLGGRGDGNSGGSTISIAPGFLFSYRNTMIKGGVKIPLLNNLNGFQEKPDPEFVFAVEFHMPPFK